LTVAEQEEAARPEGARSLADDAAAHDVDVLEWMSWARKSSSIELI
jgi:hypothetical protein